MRFVFRLYGFALALSALLLLPALLLPVSGVLAQAPLPIFDVHVHYSRDAWGEYPVGAVARMLRDAGVKWALVSSSPDDGTLKLVRHNPRLFIPELRPYRGQVGAGNWASDASTPAYLGQRLGRGLYKGIGEFHLLSAEDARTPVLQEVARMAVERGILLHVHAGAEPVRALFALQPKLRILWAHAGMVTGPAEVRGMMDTHPNLWAEVSFRAGDILQGQALHPAWESLLLAHRKRFMIGSDTYTNSRFDIYDKLIAHHRKWLALLPPQVAKAIAHGNALRVLGVKAGK